MFKDFISKINPEYNIPSRETLASTVLEDVIKKIKLTVEKELSEVSGICCTLDAWKSSYKPNKFLSFTIHYIYDDKLKSRVLKLHEMTTESTSENISNFIKDVIEEYKLQHFGSFTMITDNAKDVTGAVLQSGLEHVSCCGHLLHLTFTDVIEKK